MINKPSTLKIINLLQNYGFKAYVVGGAVRDAYLGLEINDADITTSATPTEVTTVFESNGYRVIPTGIKHGTVTVLVDGEGVEITTFRSESNYVDNRHPESVEFVDDVSGDLLRRDFTVNAMAYNETEGLIDLYGGKNDCDSKILRAVGNANERFNEDALRILRALRFVSKLGFTVEKETSKAIFKNVNLLNGISKERVYQELVKILKGKYVEETLLKYKKVIFEIIPELKACDGFDQKSKYHAYDVYTHIVKTVGYSKNENVVRLACLLHDIAKPYSFTVDEFGRGHFYGHQEKGAEMAVSILKGLKVDNKTIATVETVIRLHDTVIPANRVKVKKFLSKHGYEILRVLIEVRIADALAHAVAYVKERVEESKAVLEIANDIISKGECFTLKQLAVNGTDLEKQGLKGEEIKNALNFLLRLVIEERVENNKQSLLKAIK